MSTLRAIGYRLADTRLGDTIQAIAARELGDAARWPEIVAYNGLTPPYIVDTLAGIEESGDGGTVVLAGSHIKIPASRPTNVVSDPGDVFGTDILLGRDGLLEPDESGDFATISGAPNLRQALKIRLATHLEELVWHPLYGNPLFKLVGLAANAVHLQLARAWGERTVRSDPRIDRVERITADLLADGIHVDALAVTVDGRPLPVSTQDDP